MYYYTEVSCSDRDNKIGYIGVQYYGYQFQSSAMAATMAMTRAKNYSAWTGPSSSDSSAENLDPWLHDIMAGHTTKGSPTQG